MSFLLYLQFLFFSKELWSFTIHWSIFHRCFLYYCRWKKKRWELLMWIFLHHFLDLLLNYPRLRYLLRIRFTNEKKQIVIFFILKRYGPHPYTLRATRSWRINFKLVYYIITPFPLIQSRRLRRQLLPVLVFPAKLTNPTGSLTFAIISSASGLISIFPFGLILISCTGLPTFSLLLLFWSI